MPKPNAAQLEPYRMPAKLPARTALEILARDSQRAHVTGITRCRKMASFKTVLAGGKFIEDEEREILLALEKKCAELILLIRSNATDVVKAKFDDEKNRASRGELSASQIKAHGSLETALDEARRIRGLAGSALQGIVNERLRPMFALIGGRAVAAMEKDAEATVATIQKLWERHEIPIEESEIERALRDRIAALKENVATQFAGLAGEVLPSGFLLREMDLVL